MAKLNVDFRLLDARSEIPALRDSVTTLEEQLEFLAAQRRQHVLADLEQDADENDVQTAFQNLRYEVEYTYPRVYRGALLLLIWATYESVIVQVADFLRKKKSIPLDLSAIRGRGTLEQAKVYFPEVLDFQFFASGDSGGRIGELALLRNSFAHTAGRVSGLRPSATQALRALEKAGLVEEELGYLVPTKKGLEVALAVVDREVTSLLERALAWDDARKEEQ